MSQYVYVGEDIREYPTLPLGGPAVPGQLYDLDGEPDDGRWATPGSKAGKAAVARAQKAAAADPDPSDDPPTDDESSNTPAPEEK